MSGNIKKISLFMNIFCPSCVLQSRYNATNGSFCCETPSFSFNDMIGQICTPKSYEKLQANDVAAPKSRRELNGIRATGLTKVLQVLKIAFILYFDPLRLLVYGFQHCCELGTIPEVLGTCIRLVVGCVWKTSMPFDVKAINNLIKYVRYSSNAKKDCLSILVDKMFTTKGPRIELKARTSSQRLLYLQVISHIMFYFWAIILPKLLKSDEELWASHEEQKKVGKLCFLLKDIFKTSSDMYPFFKDIFTVKTSCNMYAFVCFLPCRFYETACAYWTKQTV